MILKEIPMIVLRETGNHGQWNWEWASNLTTELCGASAFYRQTRWVKAFFNLYFSLTLVTTCCRLKNDDDNNNKNILGITVVPREIQNNSYAKFWGVNKVHYGLCENGECLNYNWPQVYRQLNMYNKVSLNDVHVLYMYFRHTFMSYVM